MNPCLKKNISIIIPVFDEEANIEHVVENVIACMCDEIIEIIIIDDGSTDGTLNILKQMVQQYACLHYISFSRNFGHQNALKAGFDYATGDCVITMDGDMQHPPALLQDMIKLWRAGAEVVHTQRVMEHGNIFKKFTSKCFYKLINLCTPVQIRQGAADFRLLDKKIVKICKNLNEDVFFWRGLIPWMGFNQEYIEYVPNQRLHGKSKYNLRKMFRLAWDGISSFSILPLRLAGALGLVTFVFSLAYFIYILYGLLLGENLPGWSSLISVILIMGSIQLIALEFLGEYIGKIHVASKGRPCYLIKAMDEKITKQ